MPVGPTRRSPLPQLVGDDVFLADSGLETDLVFHHGFDLPAFAAFVLLEEPTGRAALQQYFRDHVALAIEVGAGIVLESPTWRANREWGAALGYGPDRLAAVNRDAIDLLVGVRDEAQAQVPVVLSGCVGPKGDGYQPDARLTADEAQEHHTPQLATFADTAADLATAMTITSPAEATGIVRAGTSVGIPVVISFTVETDGRLPDGTSLGEAISEVDAATSGTAAYFMVNCAHPSHVEPGLEPGSPWADRLRGLRANASRLSHAELDAAEDLDDGDPGELASDYRRLRARHPGLRVLGGCCGTDVRHVAAIARTCLV